MLRVGVLATPTDMASPNSAATDAPSLPLSEEDAGASHKVWIWNGHSATTIDQGVTRELTATGSNQAVTETAPTARLSADGAHLFWFANQARRLQRESIDLSSSTTWQAWTTDLSGAGRQDLVTSKFPDCRCETGTCEETCSYGTVWVPEGGVERVFLTMEFIAGQTEPTYGASTRYREEGGKWTAQPLSEALERVLDVSAPHPFQAGTLVKSRIGGLAEQALVIDLASPD